jgi:hypothetical protein
MRAAEILKQGGRRTGSALRRRQRTLYRRATFVKIGNESRNDRSSDLYKKNVIHADGGAT